MRICLLASGSKGNSLLVESGSTRILVDAGLSARELRKRLETVAVDAASLDALLVTHEHTDHIRGLGPLVRQLELPVYLQADLARQLKDVGRPDCVREFVDGEEFSAERTRGVIEGKVLDPKIPGLGHGHGDGVPHRQHGRGAGRGGQADGTGFVGFADLENDVGVLG